MDSCIPPLLSSGFLQVPPISSWIFSFAPQTTCPSYILSASPPSPSNCPSPMAYHIPPLLSSGFPHILPMSSPVGSIFGFAPQTTCPSYVLCSNLPQPFTNTFYHSILSLTAALVFFPADLTVTEPERLVFPLSAWCTFALLLFTCAFKPT